MIASSALAVVIAIMSPAPLAAQAEKASTSVAAESLKAKIAQAEGATDLDEEAKAALLDQYRKTLGYLETLASSEAAAKEFRRAREQAPKQTAALRKKLSKPETPVTLGVSKQAPLGELEQALLKERANLAAVEAKLGALEDQLGVEKERPSVIRKQLTEAKQRQDNIASEIKAPPAVGGDDTLAKVRTNMLEVHVAALNAEIRMLDEELLSQPMRIELLQAQRDDEAISVDRISTRAKLLKEVVAKTRRVETDQVLAEVEADRREAEGKHPIVVALAERNAELTGELAAVTASSTKVNAEKETASQQAKRVADDFRSARQKLDVAGLSQALGMVLLEQRRSMPDIAVFQRRVADHENEIAVARLRQIHHEEERKRLRSLEQFVGELSAELPPDQQEAIVRELTDLAQTRKGLVDQAISVDRAYVRALGDLDFSLRQLIDAVEVYDEYLASRLLWIRSSPPPNLAELRAVPNEVATLVSPGSWLDALDKLRARLTASPPFVLLLGVFGVLLWKKRALWRALQATGKEVGRPRTDKFAFTLQALLYTLLLAAPWPLLLWLLGWQLHQGVDLTTFGDALSAALSWSAFSLLAYRFFRILCRPGGLADVHLFWRESLRKSLRRALDRLIIPWLPSGAIAIFFFNQEQVVFGGGMQRLALLVAISALGMFLYTLLDPRQGILQPFVARDRSSMMYRLRFLWFGVVLTAPVMLIGLTMYGYLYTAAILVGSLSKTTWFLLGLVVSHEVAVRWLSIAHRRLTYQAMLERREAERAAAKEPESEARRIEAEAETFDIAALSGETRKLLDSALMIAAFVGLWSIWSNVLPALEILKEVTLWQQTTVVSGEVQVVPITLRDAVVATLIAMVTVVATRRLPSLLEIVLLQRLEMTAASHYTVATLSRYAIAAVGGMIVAGTIGFNWSQIQWLVAALGVGIGFGLQEIVANFISGLIILFERPIRVGDVVTVGDTDGVVTRIQIRATTIRTWERKELLVPNKEFVTGRLLNWSLSDQVTRLIVAVGVAYGSDVQKAMFLMAQAGDESSRVLSDPKPFVVFDGFGDNALSLKLRCYVGNMDDRLDTINELHLAVNRKFNDAGIVIAFPQRDLHIDASQPLNVRLRHEPREDDQEEGKEPSPK